MIDRTHITGLILAGGRGTRMGGVDKGLQPFDGRTLAEHSLRRLQPQVGCVVFNANRNLAAYEAFGVPVFADEIEGYAGPLAGMLTGLAHCRTPYLVTVPCDTPLFPQDLVARLAAAMLRDRAEIAMAAAPEAAGPLRLLRPQPVFCLLRADLLQGLAQFVRDGGRRVHSWTAQHATTLVPFASPDDDERAFFNANTLEELKQLDAPPAEPSEPSEPAGRAASPRAR